MKKIILITFLLSISFFVFGQEPELKTIMFIDDFDELSELEPDYYQYFDEIKNDELLGHFDYNRLNIDFNFGSKKSIRDVNLNFEPDFIILILGTSTTTINTVNNSMSITPIDYRNEYVNFVRRIATENSTIIVVSPPPYNTETKEEDEAIVDNINAVQELAEKKDKVHYVKLYKNILHNYQESIISPKELATWLTRLLKDEIKEFN
ncbi:MAG: SGNH/GDSL hydrolase family protein [Flavobacteriales bacterium]|nr:SGNH/GDSL hydrolase family protein [Flavobacteriales bacterium]